LPEEQLDAVTALSGSGPAFVARLIEAFIQAGVAAGLDAATSEKLTLQTFIGTAELLRAQHLTPEQLVTMVSSPNGTTVAGRAVLEASNYQTILAETIAAAARRSRELGK
jgi:pyrroline-5-carboxylate reductase